MSDLKLHRVTGQTATALSSSASKLEKALQRIVEQNLEALFGVRLLASEFSTGPVHGGRMDSIGLDENGTPVIFEYKRNLSESVINQGLFYLDWLLDHQGDFKVLVMEKLGADIVSTIDFSAPRLICIANDFTRYDEHAIRQMGRAIELVRYQHFEGDLLALDLAASSTTSSPALKLIPNPIPGPRKAKYITGIEHLDKAPQELKDVHEQLRLAIEAIGDDITTKWNKYYLTFRRLKNFASIEVYSQAKKLLVFVKVDPATVTLEEGFSRDVSNVGHMGTGDLELTVTSPETLAKALPLIQVSYDAN